MEFIATSSITVSAIPVEPEPDWHDRANCLGVDPDLFFPEQGASTREAKEICRWCEVRHDCLEFALQGGEKFGIWGGLSERERRRIRRQRNQVARSSISSVSILPVSIENQSGRSSSPQLDDAVAVGALASRINHHVEL